MRSFNDEYGQNGVAISPEVPRANSEASLQYKGLLAQSGATEVYARIGYGQRWRDEHDYQMWRTQDGFEVNLPISHADTLNVCFKDSANHWDNNSGRNYSFDIS